MWTVDGPPRQEPEALRPTDAALLIVRADHERAVRDRLTQVERENADLRFLLAAAQADITELRTKLRVHGVEGY